MQGGALGGIYYVIMYTAYDIGEERYIHRVVLHRH